MIQAQKLCLSFKTDEIFNDLSFTIRHDQRVGLVGLNGSGKSTLLKAIAGQQQLDSGTIAIANNKTLAYLPQNVVLESNKTVFDEALSTFTQLYKLLQENTVLEQKTTLNEDEIERYNDIAEQLIELEPAATKASVTRMLNGLGFSATMLEQPVDHLSVGWKMRLVLAKLLLVKADFYLFDEPTNHLDLATKEWFLQFLKESSFGFLLVCHERYFLDELCSHILELERGKGTMYAGNYSFYEQKKEHDYQLLEAAFHQQQKDIAHKKRTIERFKASASKAKMAQSMIKQLDKIELITLPPSTKNIRFSFPQIEQPGRIVLSVEGVSHSFGPSPLFTDVSFEIERNQKVALVAPNGAGKTTLFNLIAKKMPLQKGTISFGHNVSYAVFDQDQNKSLNQNRSILDNIHANTGKQSEATIRSFLGSFLFSGEDVLKPVRVLSGGEKNRVGMVQVLLQNANVLLLDEPTNHLDIPSKEILLHALQEFKGTILFVSHDREFINQLATHTIELTHHGAHVYHGNYNDYLHHKKVMGQTDSYSNSSPAPKTSMPTQRLSNQELNEQRKKITKIEHAIEKLEQKIATIEKSFLTLSYGTPAFTQAQQKLADLHKERAVYEQEWEALTQKLSS